MQAEQQKRRDPETSSKETSLSPSATSNRSAASPELNKQQSNAGIVFEPSPLLTLTVAEQFVQVFFKHKYPITPILHQEDFYASLPTALYAPDQYALLAALCAAVFTQVDQDQTGASVPESTATYLTLDLLIQEAKRARRAWDYTEKPTLQDVQTSFFIFAGLFNLDRHNSAWFYLRESITLLEALRLNEEQTYAGMSEREALFSRRTFWLLFITERAYALQRHRPLTLNCTIKLPAIDPDDPDAKIICGFLDLVSLFQNFDSNFVSTWNSSSQSPPIPFTSTDNNTSSISSAQIATLQSTLAHAIPEVSNRTEIQQADLFVTRLWLSTMTWQLCVARGLLSSSPVAESLSFNYPLIIARDFATTSALLGREAFDAHGPGILEKIFDIGCSLADVLSLRPAGPSERMEVGPKEYLGEMLRVLGMAMGGSSKYRGLLMEKAEECFKVGPRPALSRASTGRVTEIDHDGEDCLMSDVEDHQHSGVSQDEEEAVFYEQVDKAWNDYDGALSGGTDLTDFDALGQVSMAWLGSLDGNQ